MQLLQKAEVAAKKAAERKMEIDEGAKLARTVDALRNTASQEEASLSKFRMESLARIKQEIDAAIMARDSLKSEIVNLYDKRKELSIPLDKEWEELEDAKDFLDESKKNFEKECDDFNKRSILYEQNMGILAIRQSELESDRLTTDNLMKNAERKNGEAVNLLVQAEEAIKKSDIHAEMSNKAILARETSVGTRDREVGIREKLVADRERALIDREREIKDKYETLQRTVKRLKK